MERSASSSALLDYVKEGDQQSGIRSSNGSPFEPVLQRSPSIKGKEKAGSQPIILGGIANNKFHASQAVVKPKACKFNSLQYYIDNKENIIPDMLQMALLPEQECQPNQKPQQKPQKEAEESLAKTTLHSKGNKSVKGKEPASAFSNLHCDEFDEFDDGFDDFGDSEELERIMQEAEGMITAPQSQLPSQNSKPGVISPVKVSGINTYAKGIVLIV
jgi:hypothetical protein